jgi:hypothetical protein
MDEIQSLINVVLKEAEAITVNSLESLLLFITSSKGFLMQRNDQEYQNSCGLEESQSIRNK